MPHLKNISYIIGFIAFAYTTIVYVPVWLTAGQPMWFVAIAWLIASVYIACIYLGNIMRNIMPNKENKNESE